MNVSETTAVVAICGAVLSAVAVGWQIVSHIGSKRPYLRIKVTYGFLLSPLACNDQMIFLTAVNRGERPVTLSGAGFILPDTNVLHLASGNAISFPYELGCLKSCQIWIPMRKLAEDMSNQGYSGKFRLRPFYQDQTDRIFKGKSISFRTTDWIKQS